MNPATELVTSTLANFLNIYLLLIFIRILLTWFPTVEWMNQVASFLSPITDPYLNVFRSFIPPLGGLDLSPLLAILVLQVVAQLFQSMQLFAKILWMRNTSRSSKRLQGHSILDFRFWIDPPHSSSGDNHPQLQRRTLPVKPAALNCLSFKGVG